MNPDRRPDLNERPANDNRTVDLPNLFERGYRRPAGKPIDPLMKRNVWIAAFAMVILLLLIGYFLYPVGK